MSTPPDHSFSGDKAFEALSAALADAVVLIRPDGKVAYAGPGLKEVLGINPGDISGRSFPDLVHPEDDVQREDRGFWTRPLPFEREFRMRTATGEWIWVRALSSATDRSGDRPEAVERVIGENVLLLLRERISDDRIRDAEDLVRRAFDAVNNLVVISDVRLPDAPLVVVNQNFVETTGYPREEIIGQNCRFLQVRPDGTRDDEGDGQAEALEKIRTAVERGAPTHVVLRNYRKDGSLFYNRLYLTPIRGESGEVTHFVGVQNDVTGEVQQERAAESQRRLLRSFFDSASFLMGVLELREDEVRHRTANAAALTLLRTGGVDFDDVAGKTLTEVGFTEAEAEVWLGHLRECAASGRSVTFDTVFPWGSAPDGEGARSLSIVLNAADDGEPIFSYVAEDVTERRASDRERLLLAAAVEQAAEAILVTDAEIDAPGPRILYANRAHQRIFGYEASELIGRSPRMFQGADTDRGVLDRVRRRLQAGEPVQVEAVNYRKDGTPFVLEWEIAPVRNEAGEVVNWVGTQRDVTERRRLEHEVLAATGREQERMARELHDGLGQVLTGSAMKLAVLERALDAKGEDVLAAEAARVGELVSDALNQARSIARGLFPVTIEPDGLMAALQRLCESARANLGIEATFVAPDDVVVGTSEEAAHLYRIVQEAITNAVRHGGAESVEVRLERDADRLLVLTVRDDGVGIPDEALDGGEGIGLRTMAYRARRVRGTLDVRRLGDSGTAVRVRFSPGTSDVPAPAGLDRPRP